MYLSDADPGEGLAAWCFEREMDEKGFAAHCDDMRALIGWPRVAAWRPAVVLTLDEVPRPTPLQRQAIGSIVSSPGYDAFIAIVSSSPFVRGALTALRWVNPKPHYKESTHGTIESALDWLESERGTPLPKLRLMLERLGERATGGLLKRFAHSSMRIRTHEISK